MNMGDLGMVQLYLCLAIAGGVMAIDMWVQDNR